MRGGQGSACLLAIALLSALPPSLPAQPTPGPAPVGPIFVDAPAWLLNDTWTYTTHALTRAPNGMRTDTTLVLTTRIVEVSTRTVRSTSYTTYNATTNGNITTDGEIPLGGLGTRPFHLQGTSSGWVWTDRSDLAVIVTNQTGNATGWVDLGFPFGRQPLEADGATTILFLPALEDFDFPLELADAWSHTVTANTTGYVHFRAQTPIGPQENTTSLAGETSGSTSFWLNTTEDVTVTAGTFANATHIHTAANGAGFGDRWYHPDAKNIVRSESHSVAAVNDYSHVWVNLTAMSLVLPPWPGTIVLNPQRVDPGGWIAASGTANPNEDLVVSVPVLPATYSTRASAGGAWSIRLRAPRMDDFTPANADVGSHGVLVEPGATPSGWAIATVQLVLPDLSVGPSDLALSNPTPSMGVPVDVNGTVHAGSTVGISLPFNVTFRIDGVEVGRYALAGLARGQARSFGLSWTPPPGWHTVALVADPDDAIRETNEENNTASLQVFVTGPDLAPMDVLITAETMDAYPDPAAAGGVSAPVTGRLGATVNVTFVAENVGTGNASAPFTVVVVETVGLRGPPVGPRLVQATVSSVLAPGARSGPWTASWPVPARPGVYHLNVTVDTDAQVDEASESNNTFVVVVNVSGPDYWISGLVPPPAKVTTGSTHAINVTVRNDGLLAADRVVTLAAYAGMSSYPFATAAIQPLAVGASTTTPLLWTAPSTASVIPLRFVIDSTGVLDEMVETNNDASASVDVRPPPISQINVVGPSVTGAKLFVRNITTFVLTATDRSGTGLITWYAVDGGTATVYSRPFSVLTERDHTIAYWSEDNLGGREADRTLAVFVDDAPPRTGESAGDRTDDHVTVTLNATDGDVGVAYTQYRVDNGTWTNYTLPFLVLGYGPHNITFRSVDLLGNVEPVRWLDLTISPASPAPLNLKPVLAAALAAILLAIGLRRGRRKGRSIASPRTIAIAFAVVEIGTGVASATTGALAVPPLGAGLAVDLSVFLTGLVGIVLFSRGGDAPSESSDARSDK